MDSFALIQNFFTQMQCPQCGQHLEENSVSLLREDAHTFLVHLECQHCHSDIGNALVGVENNLSQLLKHQQHHPHASIMIEVQEDDDEEAFDFEDGEEVDLSTLMQNIERSQKMPRFAGGVGLNGLRRRYKDPELTPEEKERLKTFDPIGYDDVLEAHHFFENLGRNWQSLIPEEMRQCQIACEVEPPVEENAP
jgi:hypothetical protein